MKRWFVKGHFSPAYILHDPTFQDLNKSQKKIYLLLCRRSYLVKRSPTRRYSVWTYRQIARQVGLSKRQVGRIMKKLMDAKLLYRWYAGDSGSTTANRLPRAPRYEIPASKEMIKWWRRTRKVRKTIYQGVSYVRKD